MTGKPLIVAALCWYDEAPDMLERCIASLAGFADAIVSLDGAYSHFPDNGVVSWSSRESRAAIDTATRLAGLPHDEMVRPTRRPTQADKRTMLYRRAARRAGPTGWVLVIDADETLTGDCDAALPQLGSVADCDAAIVTVRTGDAVAYHPRILRALPELTCGPEYHGMLSATDPDGRRVRIRDRREIITSEKPRPRLARELNLSRLLTIHNDNDSRSDARKAAKREYVRRRTAAGIDL